MSSAVLLVAAAAAVAAGTWHWVVPTLPQPDEEVPVPPFRDLDRPGLVVGAAALAALAAGCMMSAPPHAWPVLWPLAAVGAPLALVDQLTTYLPNRLVRACWALALSGAPLAIHLAPDPRATAARMLLATGTTAVFFWLVWRLTASLGFGDVRLAPLLALSAAALSTSTWWCSLVAGTLLGALVGLVTQFWRRWRPHALGSVFPYGPALWVGLWVSVVATP